MTSDEIRDEIADIDADILLADGFESALIGFVEIFNNTIALYDTSKCIDILVADGMDMEEATEYFYFNVVGSYVGEKTPGFATILAKGGTANG